ncbi:MAG: STAS domain-containing protein [Methylacidiphilales bacterium]|nr:STAS domain-containing protein [Candidatus Methylacidiphilales bacterium]
MIFDETVEGTLAILHLKGDVDLHHSPKLRAVLQSKIAVKCPCLLINFTEVNYIDSSGLATLVEYYQGCRNFSGKIGLAALSPRVKSVFDLVRLGEVFPIYVTLDEARSALGKT